MKNKSFFCVFVLFVISINCYAQSSGSEQRLIGTWEFDGGGMTLVFNSNGTASIDGDSCRYGAAADKLVLYDPDDPEDSMLWEFYISTDGRTLIIVAGDGRERAGIVLRKRS